MTDMPGMDLVELLTVAERFHLKQFGLVVTPDFDAPPAWKARSETVVIETPGGQRSEVMACMQLWHFNIRDPAVPTGKRWRLVIFFPAMTNETMPVGTKVLVPPALRAAIQQP
jgi:hypothetical protein